MAEKIETLLKSSTIHYPTEKTLQEAYIKDYDTAYKESIADPEKFWEGVAKELDWFYYDAVLVLLQENFLSPHHCG